MSVMPALDPHLSSNGARLVALDGRVLPLRGVDLAAEASGGLASVRLTQRFANPFDDPLTATYQLPLPADGAVVDFRFHIGDRVVEGRVHSREDARRQFEDALLEGRTAALLEQDRSSLFHQEVGNIPPHTEVRVEILVEQPLLWRERGWEWRFPTVVAPRFLGDATPDAERVTVDVADGPTGVGARVSLTIGDAVRGAATSPSHDLEQSDGSIRVGRAVLDRDVVVRWPVAAQAPGVSVEVARPDDHDDAYALVTLVPPEHVARPVARDLILLIDTSGSMGGRPLAQAVQVAKALVAGLTEHDTLQLMAFSSTQESWKRTPCPMDAKHRADAARWLSALRARGGTYMHEAILAALAPMRDEAQRQVVLITDGLIGFEDQVVGAVRDRLPGGCRVHTLGVGSGVNRSLLGPVAQAGGGVEVIVAPDEDPAEAVRILTSHTGDPVLVGLRVEGDALREAAWAAPRDLYGRAPCRLALRVDPTGGALTLRGQTADGPWVSVVTLPAASAGRRVVATRFARDRVEALELARTAGDTATVDAEIERLGLLHRIATRRTSWLAVTDEATVDPTAPTHRVSMPHVLPNQMSAEGLGLRSAMPMAAPVGAAAPMPRMAMRAAPMVDASAGRSRAQKKSAFSRVADFFGAGKGAPPEVEESSEAMAPPAPPPRWHARARVVRRRDGVVVVEFTLERAVEWAPSEVHTASSASGPFVPHALAQPTTRSGKVDAGQVVRLAFVLDEAAALPGRVEVVLADGLVMLDLEA